MGKTWKVNQLLKNSPTSALGEKHFQMEVGCAVELKTLRNVTEAVCSLRTLHVKILIFSPYDFKYCFHPERTLFYLRYAILSLLALDLVC